MLKTLSWNVEKNHAVELDHWFPPMTVFIYNVRDKSEVHLSVSLFWNFTLSISLTGLGSRMIVGCV